MEEQSKFPKVLVASPIYNKMKYCLKEFLENIKSLDYQNYDVLLVDNSREDDFLNKLKQEKGIIVIKDNTDKKLNIERLISSRNKILKYAQDNNYDYILMMDSDVIPSKTIIKELLSCKKDIVSGLYYHYQNVGKEMRWLSCIWKKLSKEVFEKIKTQNPGFQNIEYNENMTENLTKKDIDSQKLMEVIIPSPGCMLLSKKIFGRFNYELPEDKKSDELLFLKKIRKAGFKIYCYTKVLCEHLVKGKYEKDSHGNLIHPLFK